MLGAIHPFPQYAIMAWRSVKHRDNCTFTFYAVPRSRKFLSGTDNRRTRVYFCTCSPTDFRSVANFKISETKQYHGFMAQGAPKLMYS
jgi:hypothetical protein